MSANTSTNDSSSPPSAKSADWTLEDIVDFEYAIRLEARQSPTEIQERDRELHSGTTPSANNRALLKSWLDCMRSQVFSPLCKPGKSSMSATGIAIKVIGVISLLGGAALAKALLHYQGTEPVNVSAFIGLFIVLQLALALLSLVFVSLPSQSGRQLDRILGIRLLQPLAIHGFTSISRFAGSKIDGIHRQALEETTGDLKGFWTLYGNLFRWKLFSKIQLWALLFNLGALTATLLSIVFSDRAFGWQTTLQIDAETLYQYIRLSSFPWSWFAGEGQGFPTLQEIDGSRIALKDGIRSLNSENLVSWWPYLSLGIIFYGLVPRLAFNILGQFKGKRCLAKLSFSHTEANRIAERIRSATIQFDSDSPKTEHVSENPTDKSIAPYPDSTASGPILCLIASDSVKPETEDDFKTALTQTLSRSSELLTIEYLDDKSRIASELPITIHDQSIALVFDSWMPPIEETKRLIKSVRNALQSETGLVIILLGMPSSSGEIQPPETSDLNIWKTFTRKLGDPYCSLQPIKR